MENFKRYLLVGDHDDCWREERRQLDLVSWGQLGNIANAADYDAWILNVTALHAYQQPKIFSENDLRIFEYGVIAHVLAGEGSIYIIGDFKTSILKRPPPQLLSSGRSATEVAPSAVDPFVSFLNTERDGR